MPVRIDGSPRRDPIVATLRPVTPRYFETVGIPLLDGRLFAGSDRREAATVALANSAFVRQVLDGGQALGRRMTSDLVDGGLSIVGVVGDVTPGSASDRPALYVSMEQVPFAGGSLVVRTEGEPGTVLPGLTARVRSVAPSLALDRTHELADLLAEGRAVTRFNALLAAGFAGIALLLAAIGVYGLTAGEVSARWRELGVRLALGASSRRAIWTVLQPGIRTLALGVILGLLLALAVGQWMGSLLHGVGPADPPTLVAVSLTLVVVGLVAASLAALPVLRSDPAATLRQE
jgi:putative ABC transport system permease protein